MSADEYTPTTEEVRWYVSNNGRIPVVWFDRFLAAHDAEVARAAKAEGKAEALSGFANDVDAEKIADYWTERSKAGEPDVHWAVGNAVTEVLGLAFDSAAEYRKVATDE